MQGPEEVDLEDAAPDVGVGRRRRLPVTLVMAVLHEDVDPAEAGEGGVDQGVTRVAVAEIGGLHQRLTTEGADLVGHRVESLLAPRCEHHVDTARGEAERDAATHTRPDPGDDGYFALSEHSYPRHRAGALVPR
jgi:hypothetical protein